MRKGLFLVLVLDVLGLCGKKGVRSVMIWFDRSDRETSAFSSTSTTTSTSTKGQFAVDPFALARGEDVLEKVLVF
jgi:hypothetical protein